VGHRLGDGWTRTRTIQPKATRTIRSADRRYAHRIRGTEGTREERAARVGILHERQVIAHGITRIEARTRKQTRTCPGRRNRRGPIRSHRSRSWGCLGLAGTSAPRSRSQAGGRRCRCIQCGRGKVTAGRNGSPSPSLARTPEERAVPQRHKGLR